MVLEILKWVVGSLFIAFWLLFTFASIMMANGKNKMPSPPFDGANRPPKSGYGPRPDEPVDDSWDNLPEADILPFRRPPKRKANHQSL
jgi:hypothetical protein